ncbi:MAG: response regulator transcription factor [Armatimonadetes bacterium]|nr:response regulator transcription factor [Armatimonadota bacterium]
MPKETILIVDDEEDILRLVEHHLSGEGYRVLRAMTGEECLQTARAECPDLIVLDLMLPGLDGLDVCRILKRNDTTCGIPIIMLTAKGEDADVVAGLELGADDYIVKPFSPKVLVARVRAALRRERNRVETDDGKDLVDIAGIKIDPGTFRVTVNSEPVDLTLTEFRILHALARRPGWVFTRSQIVRASRGEEADVTDRSVDVHVVSLRKKLGPAGRNIETVRGVGYRFREKESNNDEHSSTR